MVQNARARIDLSDPFAEGPEPLRRIHTLWLEVAGRGLPRISDLPVDALLPHMPHLALIESRASVRDAVFRFFGAALIELSGADLTGMALRRAFSEQAAAEVETQIDWAASRRLPVLDQMQPAPCPEHGSCWRLILPVQPAAEGGTRVVAAFFREGPGARKVQSRSRMSLAAGQKAGHLWAQASRPVPEREIVYLD